MNISTNRLKKIIIEEYIKEDLLDESQAAEDLLRQLIGDEEYNRRRALDNPDSRGGDTKPMKKPNKAAETMPMPNDNEPSPETASAPNPIKAAIDGIYDLVSDMDPKDVEDIFQIVFQKLPGVEMLSPGDEGYPEEKPPTEYVRGAYGRPEVGFKIKELKALIRKVLLERAGGESYEDEIDEMSNHQLMNAMEKDGMEDMIVRDGEGDLVNRKQVIAALKNV